MIWCALGIVAGVLFGIIPGAGAFLAVAVFYPFLALVSPFEILLFYIALIITSNYTNSVTGILYGIPGDAAAVTSARHGHKMFLEGKGHYAVSSNAVSSTLGSILAIGIFLFFLGNVFDLFKFYNSTVQVAVISIAVLCLTFLSEQSKWKSISLFILGGVLAKIGFDNLTYNTWGTFGIDYLTLGIPFSAVMIGLYIIPETLKFKDKEFKEAEKITKFGYDIKTVPSTMIGAFIGFWSGLIPGVTNILGSYLSASMVKSDVNKIAAAESANNSGALSSLLPLIILGIPIVSSEVLIYYLVLSRGFTFDIDNLYVFTSILYYIPFVLITCLLLSWLCFNQLGIIAKLIKKYKRLLTIGIVLFISAMAIWAYPIKEWMVISILIMSALGYFIRKWDTFPVIYGFFLTDLFWSNLMRVIAIYT
jgi:putative tricarboxylic transport membrane protein